MKATRIVPSVPVYSHPLPPFLIFHHILNILLILLQTCYQFLQTPHRYLTTRVRFVSKGVVLPNLLFLHLLPELQHIQLIPLTSKRFARIKSNFKIILLFFLNGDLLFGSYAFDLNRKSVNEKLQLTIVDVVDGNQGVEFVPLTEGAIELFYLGKEGFFDETAYNLNELPLIIHWV